MAKEASQNNETLNALVPVGERKGPRAVQIGETTYEVVQQVNVPILKHDTDQVIGIKLEQPIRHETSKRNDGSAGTIAVARVTELGSGQLFNLVLNAITASEFERAYPDNSYVGKCFAIKKLGVVAGKRYKDVQIVEIRDPNANGKVEAVQTVRD